MDNHYSDKIFLDNLDLKLPLFSNTLQLYHKKKYKEAALDAAEQLFKNPFVFHPFDEKEIPPIAKYLNKNNPEQIKYLKSYVENCLLAEKPTQPKNVNNEEYEIRYANAVNTHKGRASGAYICIRLFHVTGDKKYLDGFLKIAEFAVNKLAELQDGDHPPTVGWHPKPGEISGHDPGHVGEELIMALPFYRTLINAEQKLYFAKLFLKLADFNYRSIGMDVQFNIPLHLLTTTHLVSCVFPEFKKAPIWKEWSRTRLYDDYTGKFNTTANGYFREGVGYQKVVTNLLFKNLVFWKASGDKVPQALLNVSEKSFEYVTKINRLDSTFPLIGDSGAYGSHERHIAGLELINAAAVFFNRYDFLNFACSPWKELPMEIIYWDMGWEGIQKWEKFKRIPRENRLQQPHDMGKSGFQILGKGNMANGHQGVLHYACNINHAHFDVGSVDIWGYGRPLITDPGFSGYNMISQAMDVRDASHSMTILSRLKPLGPRIENNELTKTTQVIHKNDLQYSTCINPLYETHSIQRTMCFIAPGKANDFTEPFWLIVDTVKRKVPWPSKTEPYEIAETNFHLNAPDSKLGFDYETKTVWSKHSGKNQQIKRYAGEDIFFNGEPKLFDFHNYVKAIEASDSDGNIQISAIPKKNDFDYVLDIRLADSFTCQYGGRVKRPAVSYMYNGNLPYTCAFVLFPFKGVSNKAIVKVDGTYEKNNILATVESRNFKTNIKIANYSSAKPTFSFKREKK